MAVITDTLVTTFQTQGQDGLVSALNKITSAYNRLNNAQKRAAASAGTSASAIKSGSSSLSSINTTGLMEFNAGLEIAKKGWQVIKAGIDAATDALKRYAEYGTQIMNLRDLTGGSVGAAGRAEGLFNAGGVNDTTAIRDILRSTRDLQNKQGLTGLGRIGVAPQAGETGLHLFDRILNALEQIPPGTRRTNEEIRLFGMRQATTLQGIMRLTSEQRERAQTNTPDLSEENLKGITSMNFEIQQVGQTIMSAIITPFGNIVGPQIALLAQRIGQTVQAFGNFLQQTGIWQILAAGVWVVAELFDTLAGALEGLNWILDKINSAWDFITGFDANKATAKDKTEDNTNALQDNTDAVQNLSQHIARLSAGKGIPSALTNTDLNSLSAANMLNNIG